MKRLSMRIITIALACILLMSNAVSVAFSSSYEVTGNDNLLNRLYAFGLFENNVILDYDSSVTRAEAAYTLSKIMGYNAEVKNDKKTIDDISGSAYESAIYQVVEAGLMSCMYDNSFKPDVAVSYGDLVTAIVKTLGYDNFIDGDLTVSNYINLYKKFVGSVVKSGTSDVKWGEFIKLIDESIDTDIVDSTVDSKGNLNYTVAKGETILSDRLKITKYSGIITATEFSDLYGGSTVREGYIKIDDNTFKCNEVFAAELLGLSVDAYVQDDSANNEGIVKYIDRAKNDDRVITIKSSDIESLTTKKVEYNKDNKTKKLDLPNGIYVLYNGVSVSDYSGVSLNCKQGVVYVIDSNGDGKNDVLSIFNYDKTVVKSVDTDGNIIDLHHKDRNIKLKNEDIKVYKNGTLCSKDKIKKNDVLSVLKDINGNPLIVIVNESVVSGKVSKVRSADENGSAHKIVINDTEFSVDSTFDSLTNYEWGTANGVFFLDYNGVIVGYKQSGFDYEFGYIIKVVPDTNPLKEAMKVRLLNSDGVVETLYTRESMTINDVRYKTYSEISGNMTSCEKQLVRYKINKENKLSIIETAKNGDDWANADTVAEGKLRMTYSSGDSKLPYINATGIISDKAKVGKDTLFFNVPENEDVFNKDLYSAQYGAPMYDGENVKFKAYSLSSEKICNDVCILYTDNNYSSQKLTESSPIGVVEEVSESMDKDGEVKTAITVRTQDGAVTVQESEYGYFKSVTGADGTTGLSVQKGDMVRYLTDHKGQVPFLTVMSRVNANGELHTYSTGGGIADKFLFKAGYLYKRDDTQFILIDNKDVLTRDKWTVLDAKSSKVVVCHNTGKSNFFIAQGSVDDMNGYAETQEMRPVSIYLTYGLPKLIVVYK